MVDAPVVLKKPYACDWYTCSSFQLIEWAKKIVLCFTVNSYEPGALKQNHERAAKQHHDCLIISPDRPFQCGIEMRKNSQPDVSPNLC